MIPVQQIRRAPSLCPSGEFVACGLGPFVLSSNPVGNGTVCRDAIGYHKSQDHLAKVNVTASQQGIALVDEVENCADNERHAD